MKKNSFFSLLILTLIGPFILIALGIPTLNIPAATGASASAEDLAPATNPLPHLPNASCTDSVSVGGHALGECQGTTFNMGGQTWTLSVYYTLDTNAGDHWILTHTQAANILPWMETAARAYYAQSGKTYGAAVCDRHIRAKIQLGDGWSGIAWWPNSCFIGLDAPMIRGNGGQGTTLHEMRHKFFQFAYADCVDDWKGGYSGNADFVEGDADYGPTTVGDYGYFNNSYDPHKNMYEHGYGNRFTPYYSEHVAWYASPSTSPGDADYLSEGMVEHMERCELYDDLYVERETVEALTPYTYEEFFLNFFAANWGFDWANPATQPDLTYFEQSAPSVAVGAITPDYNVNLATTQSYVGHTTPDKWAGQYYQFTPQAGCDFVMLEGDGAHGAKLGWGFMGANTAASTLTYSGWVGQDFARVIAGHGVNNRIAATVVAFSKRYDYDLTATCVQPQIEIELPISPNHVAYVGDPLSPVAFMGYIRVTSSGEPVTGIPADWFVLDVGGSPVIVDTLYEVTKGQYLGVFVPPAKPVGTTWANLRACLNTTGLCDTNNNALLYVPPGNVDMVLLHDASGSMSDVDVPGDYSRLEQAKLAARLLVLLARTGDSYGIMDFSAANNPPGCNPNCPADNHIIYPKTAITNPATQIPLMQAAIDTMTAREWTNLGQGLVDAQLMALGAPYSDNNKVVTVLSDGEENINPMYDAVADTLSVVVNTWGFSGEAPNDLLARIAAEQGGEFNYVSTSPGSSLWPATQEALRAEAAEGFRAAGIAPAQAEELAEVLAPSLEYLPGGLALADSYEYLHTAESGGARVMQGAYTAVAENIWQYQNAIVSDTDSYLLLVSTSKQPEYGGCSGWKRDVEVLLPGGNERQWIPISPAGTVPANWDVRNSKTPSYSDALYVTNPAPGQWRMRTKLSYMICAEETAEPNVPLMTSDFLMNGAVWGTINLDAHILLENGQGRIGDPVPLVATVLRRDGAMASTAVLAMVERPGTSFDLLWLHDDGQHGDGSAGDGVYANTYYKSILGGAYNVSILAGVPDPSAPDQLLLRLWKGSYYMEGDYQDTDDDRFPPWWEDRYPCMDRTRYDNPQADYDQDGATNWLEWEHGTNPCVADTDGGGEMDGSEISHGHNPHWDIDDTVRPIFNWSVRPLNQAILVRWSRPISYTHVFIRVEDTSGGGNVYDGGQTGEMMIPLPNNVLYEVLLWGETETGEGSPTDVVTVMPQSDPDAPSGFFMINNGAPATADNAVSLYVNASDVPLDGLAAPGGSITAANDWTSLNDVSGDIQMRFANEMAGPWTAWEPYVAARPWVLTCQRGQTCPIYGQFRDAAGNESLVISDDIFITGTTLYLPIVTKN